jgi:hypothetical protein
MRAIGPGRRVIYWLMLVSGHDLPEEFWNSLMEADGNRELF